MATPHAAPLICARTRTFAEQSTAASFSPQIFILSVHRSYSIEDAGAIASNGASASRAELFAFPAGGQSTAATPCALGPARTSISPRRPAWLSPCTPRCRSASCCAETSSGSVMPTLTATSPSMGRSRRSSISASCSRNGSANHRQCSTCAESDRSCRVAIRGARTKPILANTTMSATSSTGSGSTTI